LKAGERLECTILSESLWGFDLHFNYAQNRSVQHIPKLGDERGPNPEKCLGCRMLLPMKDLYYLHVFNPAKLFCFIEIPPGAKNTLIKLFEGCGPLRGYRVIFARTKADNGRLRVERPSYDEQVKVITPGLDPYPTLLKLWTLNETKMK